MGALDHSFYDSIGRFVGSASNDGDVYDSIGQYKGHVNENGEIFDSIGQYVGKSTSSDNGGAGSSLLGFFLS